MKRYTIRHVIYTLIGIAGLTFVLYTTIILRDYNFSLTGGPHLVPKIAVPGPPSFSLSSNEPGKITCRVNLGSSDGCDIQISRFKNFAVARSYRTVVSLKEVGLLKSGKTYYVRSRSVVTKPGTSRKVHGSWGAGRQIKVKESTKEYEKQKKKEMEEQREKSGFKSRLRLPF